MGSSTAGLTGNPQFANLTEIIFRLRVSRPAKLLLFAFAEAWGRGDFHQARQAKLAKMVGLQRRWTQEALYELRDRKLITVRRRARKSNVYELGPALLARLKKGG